MGTSTAENIKEQTQNNSTGSTTKKECGKHGEFKAVCLRVIGTKPIFSNCPKCAEERKAEEERLKDQANKDQINKELQKSEIPKRYQPLTMDDFNPSVDTDAYYAIKVARKYLDKFSERKKMGGSLVFCGKPGTGKTHLACSIGMVLLGQGYRVRYKNIFNLMADIKATYAKKSEKTEAGVINSYIGLDLLIIDEVGVQYGSDAEKILFYQIINGRYEEVKPTILISNLPENELTEFIGERCIDRMREGGGAVVPFTWDSYRK